MHIVTMAFGSRCYVQPYVALGLGLKQVGHNVSVLANDDFEDFITNRGLAFSPLGMSVKSLVQGEAGQDYRSR